MQPQVYFGGYFELETSHGTELVPDDVIGRTVGTAAEAFENYVEGKILDLDEVIEHKQGWLGRYHMPGFLDSTSWSLHKSEELAYKELAEMYGS